jgi:hypothetical protein
MMKYPNFSKHLQIHLPMSLVQRDICKISFCKSHYYHGSSFGSVKTYSRNLHCILQEIRRSTHLCTQEFGIGGGELSLKESAREHALKRHCAHFPPSFYSFSSYHSFFLIFAGPPPPRNYFIYLYIISNNL